MSTEDVLERALYRTTEQPVQVRLLSQSGDEPQKTTVFESPDGAYVNTWEHKEEMEDGSTKKTPWTRIILRTDPVSGFLYPGPFKGFQDNKFKNLSIYLQQALLWMILIGSIVEIAQVWYLTWGMEAEGVGNKFWKDVWFMTGLAFASGVGLHRYWSTAEDNDLKVIYLQSIRGIEDDQGRTFYICTRAFSFFGVLKDLQVDTPEEAMEEIRVQIEELARKNNPGEILAAKDKIVSLQAELSRRGGPSPSEESKHEYQIQIFREERNRAAMILGIIFIGILSITTLILWSMEKIP